MSFKGLAFVRQWAKEHIYKPRVLGEPQRSQPPLKRPTSSFLADGQCSEGGPGGEAA
jgi:hypothetical protein